MRRGGPDIANEVVVEVASESGTDVLDLPPLFDSIDPDALDTLVRSMSEGQVSFVYAGQRIVVDSEGTVRVEERSTSGSSG